MRLCNLKQAFKYEVEQWIIDSIPNITPYQKERIKDDQIVVNAPFRFYKYPELVEPSLLWRLSIILYVIYFLLLFVFLPFNWLIRGVWGYSTGKVYRVYQKWGNKIGFD